MKIYTKTGDKGETGLFGGSRVSKSDARVEAYGSLDELNAALGIVRSLGLDAEIDRLLATVQSQLFDLGAELATPPARSDRLTIALVAAEQVVGLEAWVDHFEAELAPLTTFVLPGGSAQAAQMHWARVQCRRAERRLVALSQKDLVRDVPLAYVNRLSDLLFVLARVCNRRAEIADVPWQKSAELAPPKA